MALSAAMFKGTSRPLGVGPACLPLCYGIVGKAGINRGSRFGWKPFAAVVVLAIGLRSLVNSSCDGAFASRAAHPTRQGATARLGQRSKD